MAAMSFSPGPSIDRLRESLEEANRVITRFNKWLVALTFVLVVLTAAQVLVAVAMWKGIR